MLLDDDGTMRLHKSETAPADWLPTEDPQVYRCPHPECLHRRFDYRGGRPSVVQMRCFVKQDICPGSCELVIPFPTPTQVEGSDELVYFYNDPRVATMSTDTRAGDTAPIATAKASQQTQGMGETAPPSTTNPARLFIVESDGSICYEKQGTKDWEPPRDIVGYQRDPENPWRFLPLIWPDCQYRKIKQVQFSNCGCLGQIVTCLCEGHPSNKKPIEFKTCENCQYRKEI